MILKCIFKYKINTSAQYIFKYALSDISILFDGIYSYLIYIIKYSSFGYSKCI